MLSHSVQLMYLLQYLVACSRNISVVVNYKLLSFYQIIVAIVQNPILALSRTIWILTIKLQYLIVIFTPITSNFLDWPIYMKVWVVYWSYPQSVTLEYVHSSSFFRIVFEWLGLLVEMSLHYSYVEFLKPPFNVGRKIIREQWRFVPFNRFKQWKTLFNSTHPRRILKNSAAKIMEYF